MKTMIGVLLVSLVGLICAGASAQDLSGWIVYSDGKDAIKENIRTDEKINLTSDFDLAVSEPTFSRNGEWLAWVSEGRIFVRFLPDGEVKKIELSPGNYQNPSISPDGQYLSFEIVEKKKSLLIVYPLGEGKVIALGKGKSSCSTWNFDAKKPILTWIESVKKKKIGTLTIFEEKGNIDYKPFLGKGCQNLAWTSDGSLTYEFDSIIYSEKGEKIVEGTCPQWTEEEGLLFRGTDGALYYLYQAKQKKVLDSVPEWFHYYPSAFL